MNDVTIGNQQRSLELRLAWLGGIMDGEGTISFGSKYSNSSRQSGYHFRPEFKVTNSDEKMIDEIKSILDELKCSYYINVQDNPSKMKENWKKYTRITVEGIKRLQKLLPVMIPYLVSKKEQAELLMQYIESRLSGPHKSKVTKEQEAIVLKVRQLNHRGVLNRPETVRRTPIKVGDDTVRPDMRVSDIAGNMQCTA